MQLLAVDCETTGLDTENDYVTELGYVVWDTQKHAPVHLVNVCFNWRDMPPLSDEIVRLTGITNEHLDNWGVMDEKILAALKDFVTCMESCDWAVAHNAPFDKGMVATSLKRVGLDMPETPWIDTCVDLPYPSTIKSRNLNHTSADHKINPNLFAHRALFDVMQMIQLLNKYDINKVVERARTPNVTLVAVVRKPWEDPKPEGQKDNDVAKQNGFRWNGTDKTWTRNCKASEIDEIRELVKFPIKVVD